MTAVVLDVTEDAAPQRLVDIALERYGRLDIVLSNAGIIQVGPVQVDTAEQVQAALATMAATGPDGAGRPPADAGAGLRADRHRYLDWRQAERAHLLPYSTAKFAAVGFPEAPSSAAAR